MLNNHTAIVHRVQEPQDFRGHHVFQPPKNHLLFVWAVTAVRNSLREFKKQWEREEWYREWKGQIDGLEVLGGRKVRGRYPNKFVQAPTSITELSRIFLVCSRMKLVQQRFVHCMLLLISSDVRTIYWLL